MDCVEKICEKETEKQHNHFHFHVKIRVLIHSGIFNCPCRLHHRRPFLSNFFIFIILLLFLVNDNNGGAMCNYIYVRCFSTFHTRTGQMGGREKNRAPPSLPSPLLPEQRPPTVGRINPGTHREVRIQPNGLAPYDRH